jgi:hypothetical protein
VGTEVGFFISIDGGREWKSLMSGLPTVRVDDILIHPRDGDVIIGTHGRGIYILDDITAMQQLTPQQSPRHGRCSCSTSGLRLNG